MPNQKCNPTDEQRAHVRMLAANGIPLAEIGRLVNIRSPKTLRRYFREELIRGRMAGRASIFAAQYKMALSGKHPYATISFLRRNAHWHEGMEVDRFVGSGIQNQVWVMAVRTVKPDREPDRNIMGLNHDLIDRSIGPWNGEDEPEEGQN